LSLGVRSRPSPPAARRGGSGGRRRGGGRPPRPPPGGLLCPPPPIHSTSSSVNPSNSLHDTSGSGPVNHSSPSPLTLIAKLRQLIVIAVTTLEPGTSLAASAMAFAEAMDSRRNE